MVAREGSITRAAQLLNISQPALSMIISDLEHNVRTQLFERIPKGVRLTSQGEALYVYARKFVEEHEAFENLFYEKNDEIEGKLKIVTTPYLGSEWLMLKIEKFLKKHPKLRIRIEVREDKDIHTAEGDVMISTPLHHQPNLIQKVLFKVHIRLIACPTYLKKHGTPEQAQDLDAHQLITYGGSSYSPYGNTNWILTMGREGQLPRESYLEINSLQGIINAARAGYGIAEVPDFPGVLRDDLEEIKLNIEVPTGQVNYIYHSSRLHSKKLIPYIPIFLNRLKRKDEKHLSSRSDYFFAIDTQYIITASEFSRLTLFISFSLLCST
ncbi:LysR family transcriptional regulator [Candidatus Odyssella thessalonicensis]|uniref:LysR family transcriptional regulator n=1 Tax=Candidatus Odyssella thessalonicensis TaxID=84647 RepID=UPI000225B953